MRQGLLSFWNAECFRIVNLILIYMKKVKNLLLILRAMRMIMDIIDMMCLYKKFKYATICTQSL